MDLNINELVGQMLEVARGEFGNAYEDAKDFAEAEFKKLLENSVFLAENVAAGDMTPERARRHLRMSKKAAEAVLLTVEGIGLDAAENAINGALDAVKGVVNDALPVDIL